MSSAQQQLIPVFFTAGTFRWSRTSCNTHLTQLSQKLLSYDNVLKYLAAEYPSSFIQWLLAVDDVEIQTLPTELGLDPIRADTVYFLPQLQQIVHLEFQTGPASTPPLPLRLLDYWVRLYRQYGYPIEQVVIFLKQTNVEAVYVEQFTVGNTTHRYRVVRLWEQDPAPLLANPALLPLAVLAQTDAPTALMQQVAFLVDTIKEPMQQRNISACAEILASLKFDKDFIRQFLREEFMRESAIYQEILQEGVQQGLQQGKATLVLRQLERQLGSLLPELRLQIQQMSIVQIEELGEELLDFSSMQDLIAWLQLR